MFFFNIFEASIGQYTISLIQIFISSSPLEKKNCKSGELIRQNVTEQHYFAPERPESSKHLHQKNGVLTGICPLFLTVAVRKLFLNSNRRGITITIVLL